jgi:phosphodiesterase/alkaline phosphatase D-like protein
MEAVAQGDAGVPLGREQRFARIFSATKDAHAHNIVYPTADVHYTAAISYHPDRAPFQDACSRATMPACTTGRCHCNRSPLMERAMTSCWICSVPSKMSKILASRCIRSTGYSRV